MNLESWGKGILKAVTEAGEPGRPLYFYVDSSVLSEISGITDPDLALQDFCSAYQLTMPKDDPIGYYYRSFTRLQESNFESRAFFEFIAALAMTVLAVTENVASSRIAIYKRQRQLLGLPGSTMPPKYDDYIYLIWGVWNRWLQEVGKDFGLPVITEAHPKWSNIGWPMAQGIIRKKDHITIQEWIHARGLWDIGDLDIEPIYAQFKAWVLTAGSQTQRIREQLQDSDTQELLRRVFVDELTHKSAVGNDSKTRRLTAQIAFDSEEQEFSLSLDDDYLRSISDKFDGSTVRFVQNKGSWLKRPQFNLKVILANPDALMKRGFKDLVTISNAPDMHFQLMVPSKDRCFLSATDRIWYETKEVRLGEDYSILCPAEEQVEAIRFARDVSDDSIWSAEISTLDGWIQIGPFKFDRNPTIEKSWIPRAAKPLILRLVGGLKHGTSTYLHSGLPSLEYPASEFEVIHVNGKPLDISKDGGTLKLKRQNVVYGDNQILLGSFSKNFRVEEYINDVPISSDIGFSIGWDGTSSKINQECGDISNSNFAISGMYARGFRNQIPKVTFHPYFKRYFAITSNAQVFEIESVLPYWVQLLGLQGNPRSLNLKVLASRLPRKTLALIQEHAQETHEGKKFAVLDLRNDMSDYKDLPELDFYFRNASDALESYSVQSFEIPVTIEKDKFEILLNACQSKKVGQVYSEQGQKQVNPALGEPIDLPEMREDQLLEWLSEAPNGFVSRDQFKLAVAWINSVEDQRPQIHKESIERRLVSLGYIEVDYVANRVAIAPATAIFPANGGTIAFLTGARPKKMVQTLIEGAPNLPGIEHIYLQLVTMKDSRGNRQGPTLFYLSWDPLQADVVASLFKKLGIVVAGDTPEIIIKSWPTLSETLDSGIKFTAAPAGDFLRRENRNGTIDWYPATDESAGGLYKYLTFGKRTFAWVSNLNGEISRVDISQQAGMFMWMKDWQTQEGITKPLLTYFDRTQHLEVPLVLAFPSLLERALVAHSGIAPFRVHKRHSVLGETWILIYNNVDFSFCKRICDKLSQPIERRS